MHVCITWGVKLHNLSSGAKGKIFKFLASDEQFSDVFDCYPRALNPTKFPGDDFAFVKNLR